MVVRFGCYGRILRFFDTLILDKNTLLSFCGDIMCTVQSNYSTRNLHALNKTNRKTGRVFKLNGSILCAKLWNVWFGIKTFVRLLIETAIFDFDHKIIFTSNDIDRIRDEFYSEPHLFNYSKAIFSSLVVSHDTFIDKNCRFNKMHVCVMKTWKSKQLL